jgi:hypothetical protein
MPNRILKESICTSETIDALTPDEECFFYRIIVNCDDYGRMDARIPVITAKCYPLKSSAIKRNHIEKMLDRLQKVGILFLYEGGKYLQITTWESHQQIRAKRSKFPAPREDEIKCNQLKSDDSICPRNPIQSNPNPIRNPNTEKHSYAEFVKMTEDEHQKLIAKFGESETKDKIEALNLWKGSKGKTTASDYLTILNWDRRERKDKPQKPEAMSAQSAWEEVRQRLIINPQPPIEFSTKAITDAVKACQWSLKDTEADKKRFITEYNFIVKG